MPTDMPPERTHGFEVLYNETTIRDAVRTYVFRRFVADQKRLWMLSGLMIVMAAYFAWKGQSAVMVALAASAALMAPVLAALGWWVHLSNTLDGFRRMASPRASIGFRDDALELSSDKGRGELPWSALTEVWERPGYWMIFTGRNVFNVIPKANVPEDAKAWFRDRNRTILKRM